MLLLLLLLLRIVVSPLAPNAKRVPGRANELRVREVRALLGWSTEALGVCVRLELIEFWD